jgi:hypothetical protein
MKTITSFICVAFALLVGPFALLPQAQAVVPAADGVSLDDNPSLALQNDADSKSERANDSSRKVEEKP